eukprot:CAMPEP_0175761538 /NCGR_PEP_ID=MMETSP0097-20121207/66708_1 /TAXON_ID=311494 /ORGANISM="Alexandrium monilatum, Strain CCMP3105" /LENGTH=240 /DNA_ID=CAMNT_0017071109 /DNA_START=17 /DNA_END=735 /DNA_ORIENTATION=-
MNLASVLWKDAWPHTSQLRSELRGQPMRKVRAVGLVAGLRPFGRPPCGDSRATAPRGGVHGVQGAVARHCPVEGGLRVPDLDQHARGWRPEPRGLLAGLEPPEHEGHRLEDAQPHRLEGALCAQPPLLVQRPGMLGLQREARHAKQLHPALAVPVQRHAGLGRERGRPGQVQALRRLAVPPQQRGHLRLLPAGQLAPRAVQRRADQQPPAAALDVRGRPAALAQPAPLHRAPPDALQQER